MKSFLNFPDLTGLQNSSILAENTSDHDIDDEDKIKQQKSLDEIADLLTSSNEQEIAQGFDLITQSIPSGNYHHQNLGKIFYLHQLQEKLVEKNPSFLRNKQLNDDFKLKELSEELTLIIDHSSLKSKDEVFFQVTIFFHNIFNILCFFYNTKNHQLENVLNFDSEYPNSIKKLMDFHFKLFSIFETKPLPVDDFKKLINQNFELFFNSLPSDYFSFKLVFRDKNPEIIEEFFRIFKEKKIDKNDTQLNQFLTLAFSDLNHESINFIKRELLNVKNPDHLDLQLTIDKCISTQLSIILELGSIDKDKIKNLLSFVSCLLPMELATENIFHQLAKIKDKEIFNLFFLHLQSSETIERHLAVKSFDAYDENGRTPLFLALDHDNIEFIDSLIRIGFSPASYKTINPENYSFFLSYVDCNNFRIISGSINALGLTIEENKFEALNKLVSHSRRILGMPCLKLQLVNSQMEIIEKTFSAIEFAVILDREYAASLLTFHDIKAFLKNEQKLQALYFAILNENKNIFSILSFNNFDITSPIDSKGLSAFDYAIIYNFCDIIRNLYFLKKINLNQEKKYQLDDGTVIFMQPLQFAVSFGNFETIDAILLNEADVNYKTSSQISALSLAITKKDKDLIKFLLERNAKIDYHEIEKICADAKFKKNETQEIKDFISLSIIEISKKIHAKKLQPFSQRFSHSYISNHVSCTYFNKDRHHFQKFFNDFDFEILKIFKSQIAFTYFKYVEDNLLDFFLNMKLVKESILSPKQVVIEIIKQKTQIPFFCILICQKKNLDRFQFNKILESILSLDERCLGMLANQIAKNITANKMLNFEHSRGLSLKLGVILEAQKTIKADLDLCYHQKFDDALIFFQELITINNTKFLSLPLNHSLPHALKISMEETSKEQILSFVDSLKITIEMSKLDYSLEPLIPMIKELVPISLSFNKTQDAKKDMKYDQGIIDRINLIATQITEQSKNTKETSIDLSKIFSHLTPSSESSEVENKNKPNPQISPRDLNLAKLKKALSRSRKKSR